MRIEELKKVMIITDHTTHVHAILPYADEQGAAARLEFIYNEGGLRFRAKHYHGWACTFHGYDEALYTDAHGYLDAVCPSFDRRLEWAKQIQGIMQREFFKARLQKGQPCRVMVPNADGIPLFYDGVVKSLDTDDDSLLVVYDGGKRLTAKPKKVGNSGLTAYQGRGGGFVTLGGHLATNQNFVVPL